MKMDKVENASHAILQHTGFNGKIGMIMGSGLGSIADILTEKKMLPYSKIPHYPQSSVEGHKGELIKGILNNKEVLVARGRVHCYEGFSIEEVGFPIQVFKKCGIRNIIITNSSGSLRKEVLPGTIMTVIGHLDCTFQNLTGDPYLENKNKYHSAQLISIAKEAALANDINVIQGNYCWTLGPAYETPAEIKYLKSINGSAVGMSTLPEIELAGSLGLNILTLSLLTNLAAGLSDHPLTHKEVLENASRSKDSFIKLVSSIIERI